MDPFLSATEIAAAIRKGELDPVEVVDTYLSRVDALNPKLNAVVWRNDEAVRAEAVRAREAVRAGRPLGPLHGVPIPIKDLTAVEGWPTTYGSKAGLGNIAGYTSHVAQAYRDAGAILAYRTNTPEFGTMPVTENEAHGPTRNPWNTERTPGGSSGGAAAAVAAGLAPVAHANDGGGSIRIPASCCGLVGLKPSRGRISEGPLVSDCMHGGAVQGVVSHTVADTALTLDVASGFDPGAWYNAPAPSRPFLDEVGAPTGRLRIAYTTKAPTGVPVDAACVDAVLETAKLLADAGHEVFEGTPDWPDENEITPAFLVVWSTGSAYFPVEDWSKIEGVNSALREQASQLSSLDYVQGVIKLQMMSRRLVAAWGKRFDLLLTPTLANEPVPVGAFWQGGDLVPVMPLLNAATFCPFTPMFNVSGQPAISLPMHWSESGLPIGVQLVGKPFGEAELIRVASQLETMAPWRSRRPPVS